jgi:hypothetical protein
MDVELPDGTVIEGVPDGMSKADLVAKLKANGYDTSKLGAPEAAPAKLSPAESFKAGLSNFVGKDLLMGGLRGAAGIGATIMQPFQAALDPAGTNQAMRAGIDGGIAATGADPSSLAFQTGKLGTEVAGTAGVGGALAAPLRGVAPRLANAVASGGFSTGVPAAPALAGRAADMGTRMVGGGVTGAASAGLVDPSSAGAGGAIGAALPPALKGAGLAGQAVGKVFRGPEQAPEIAAAINAARQSGYVIPPTQANPTLGNRLLEGFAGKLTTAQNASAKNAAVTNAKAAEAIGLPPETKLSLDVLNKVRSEAGKAYDAVSGLGTMKMPASYDAALDKIVDPYLRASKGFPGAKVSPVVDAIESLRTPIAEADSVVAKIKELRSLADDAYAKGDKELGKALKSGADALEGAVDAHMVSVGAPADLLSKFREARTLIAKTYSVQRALNDVTGTVDAKKLAGQLTKGKPLSGGLRDAAEFAARFPKAAQTPEIMGSLPGTSPLDWAAAGSVGAATGNPLALAGVLGRPMARSLALSPAVQNRLLQAPRSSGGLLGVAPYRFAPLLGTDQ